MWSGYLGVMSGYLGVKSLKRCSPRLRCFGYGPLGSCIPMLENGLSRKNANIMLDSLRWAISGVRCWEICHQERDHPTIPD